MSDDRLPEAPGGAARDVPSDGRDRLLRALRHPGVRGQAVAAVLLAVLGFAAVTQVKANGKEDSYVGARQGDLIQYINSLSLASQRAESEIAKLDSTRSALGNDAAARQTALARDRQQADTLGILAGTLRAQGPGVRVTVTEGGTGVGSNQLINGLQELRDAGAEVIELNDKVRVIAQTSVQDTPGGGVLVDGNQLKPPYVIEAIGDPHTLSTALVFSGGFVSEVKGVGGKVAIKELESVAINAVRALPTTRYAQPDATR